MPSKNDIQSVDTTQLHIDPKALIAINAHNNDYSFIVYQFYQNGDLVVTPFGYLCKPNADDTMILPTIHGHPHNNSSIHSQYYNTDNYLENNLLINKLHIENFKNEADFDHIIYTLIKSENGYSEITPESKILGTQNKYYVQSIAHELNNIVKKIKQDYKSRKIRIFVPINCVPNKITITGYQKK